MVLNQRWVGGWAGCNWLSLLFFLLFLWFEMLSCCHPHVGRALPTRRRLLSILRILMFLASILVCVRYPRAHKHRQMLLVIVYVRWYMVSAAVIVLGGSCVLIEAFCRHIIFLGIEVVMKIKYFCLRAVFDVCYFPCLS